MYKAVAQTTQNNVELLTNGDFTQGPANWTITKEIMPNQPTSAINNENNMYTSSATYGGRNSIWLRFSKNWSYRTIYAQNVQIPQGFLPVDSLELSYIYVRTYASGRPAIFGSIIGNREDTISTANLANSVLNTFRRSITGTEAGVRAGQNLTVKFYGEPLMSGNTQDVQDYAIDDISLIWKKKEYTVTYRDEKTGTETTESVIRGERPTQVPSISDADFSHWETASGTRVANIATTRINSDVTYVAKYTRKHTVIFRLNKSDGTTETREFQVPDGTLIADIAENAKTQFTLPEHLEIQQWTEYSDATKTPINFTTNPITRDMVFAPVALVWKIVPIELYNADGTTRFRTVQALYSQSADANANQFKPTMPNGYEFVEWEIME